MKHVYHLILLALCLFSLLCIAFLRFFCSCCISESSELISSLSALAFSFITRVVVEAMLAGRLMEDYY